MEKLKDNNVNNSPDILLLLAGMFLCFLQTVKT